MSANTEEIHLRAIEIAARYKKVETELIAVLQEAEEHRVHIHRGHSSLFHYVTQELGLSENLAYALITVSRKARDFPELKACLEAGKMTLTNAKRIAAVLTPETRDYWIPKACELSSRQLEKAIAGVKPQEATPERATYVSFDRLRLELGLSEQALRNLKRVQDLLSQSKKRPVSLEETIEVMTAEYLDRHDPIIKARRRAANKKQTDQIRKLVARRVNGRRTSIPRELIHQVNLRDGGRCTHRLPSGQRCNQSRWVEVHHIQPLSLGGEHTLDNLTTLCWTQHRLRHEPMAKLRP